MEKKVASLDYKELKSDIEFEIFGIRFGIGLDRNYVNKLRRLKYLKDDEQALEEGIDAILGQGAYRKIKIKYEKDQEKKIDNIVWMKIVLFVKEQFENYTKKFERETIIRKQSYKHNNRKLYNNRRKYYRY